MSIAPDIHNPSSHRGPHGCRQCRQSQRDALDVIRDTAIIINPRESVSGFALPRESAPVPTIRAWFVLARAATYELSYLTDTMAFDLELASDDADQRSAQIEQIRRIARSLLLRLQPGLRFHERLVVFGSRMPMDPFVEAVQIRDAVEDLAVQLGAILATCPCTDPDGPGAAISRAS